MNKKIFVALLLCGATPVVAQDVTTSTSGSGAEANSGSISGASSDNQNANIQNGNIGVSENTNTSTSSSGAVSGSNSTSGSISDQQQGLSQGQSANNTQGQDQGQSQGQMQDQNLDSSQANSQGVTFNQTWNTKNRETTKVFTNQAVPLTSSSSFSSDYCGGNISGGASAAPIGISIGGSAPKFDKSCQALRRSEKFGMAAVNAQNMGQHELAGRLMSMMIWSICTSDSGGPDERYPTAQACDRLLLLGTPGQTAQAMPAQPLAAKAREPRVAYKDGSPTVEVAARAQQTTVADNKTTAAVSTPKP